MCLEKQYKNYQCKRRNPERMFGVSESVVTNEIYFVTTIRFVSVTSPALIFAK